jgi:hypothetical protein
MSRTSKATSANPNEGREANGRFAPGNAGGPGNPFARKVAALRSALIDAVTPQDITEIMYLVVFNAKAGSLEWTKFLFQYAVGKPRPAVNPDTLDLDELMLTQASAVPVEAVKEFVARIPPPAAVLMMRVLTAGLSKRFEQETRALAESAAAPQDGAPQRGPKVNKRGERPPSPNGGNGHAAARSDGPPSPNGDDGTLAVLTRFLETISPCGHDLDA